MEPLILTSTPPTSLPSSNTGCVNHNDLKNQRSNDKEIIKIKNIRDDLIQNYYNQCDLLTYEFLELRNQLNKKEKELKDQLQTEHLESLDQFSNLIEKLQSDISNQDDKEQQQIDFELKYEFPIFTKLDCLKTIIDSQKIKKEERILKRDNNQLFRYNRYTGVHCHNLENVDDSVLLICKDSTDLPVHLGFFYQTHPVNGVIYMFNEDNYFYLDTNVSMDKLRWKSGDFQLNNGSSAQSCISDGKDSIYITGGTLIRYIIKNNDSYLDSDDINGSSGKKIYKFSISTKDFTEISELPLASRYHSLSYHDDWLYLIGGLNDAQGYLNKIDRFNSKTLEFENIIPCIELNSKFNHISSGFYNPNNKSLYYLSSEKVFTKYDLLKKESTSLLYPFENRVIGHFISKLFFDGFNYAYLIIHEEKSLYQYDLKNNSWEIIKDIFQSKICYNDYISLK